ncbi:hypothetical protein STRIC_2232 [Streptococcus ictaluri 707-05]|uniref:Cross-wall-targeting lipoprotein signal n=2 Tax=Streptococcus ictaluri TaxID=380397 RepID=G5K1H4_9STRE|nr:hypothetical protein STRIC_2232 [Streptococcus ictaluri 707-05]
MGKMTTKKTVTQRLTRLALLSAACLTIAASASSVKADENNQQLLDQAIAKVEGYRNVYRD